MAFGENTGWSFFESMVTTFFVNWSICNLTLAVLLFKNNLTYIVGSLLPSRTITHAEQSLSNACIFSIRHILDLRRLRSTRQHFSTTLGTILASKITKKYKKCEKHHPKWIAEGTLSYSLRMETKRQNIALFSLTWKLVHWQLTFLLLCVSLHMPINKYERVDLGHYKYILASRGMCKYWVRQ